MIIIRLAVTGQAMPQPSSNKAWAQKRSAFLPKAVQVTSIHWSVGVRQHLTSGHPIIAIGNVSAYYGSKDDPNAWNIGDRGGGTFAEVAELGDAFAAEVLHVAHTITTEVPAAPFWSEQVTVNAAADPGEHDTKPNIALITERPDIVDPGNIPAEIMLLGLGDLVLVGQPGEVFSETAITLKIRLRHGLQNPCPGHLCQRLPRLSA